MQWLLPLSQLADMTGVSGGGGGGGGQDVDLPWNTHL